MPMTPERKREYMREYWKKNKEQKKAYYRRYREKHGDRLRAEARARHWENRDQRLLYLREYRLKKLFGLDEATYQELSNKQNNLCAICDQPNRWYIEGRKHYRLAVDHCHIDGRIRGLLCNRCNLCLGWFEDRREVILKYIEEAGK